jgi:DNA-binding MarR family transcriptional regulator
VKSENADAPYELLALENQLCFALYAASRAITRAYRPLLEPLGLTYPQYLVLLALWRHDEQPVRELGTCLELDSGTLTPLLKRLERDGLVERRRDREDQRVVKIALTRAGKQLEAKARDIPVQLAELAGYDLRKPRSVAAIGRLRRELQALASRLEPFARAHSS